MSEQAAGRSLPAWATGLYRLGQRAVSRRIPYIQQLSAVDCGAACLSMALRYFGSGVRPEEVRAVLGDSSSGVSARALMDAAARFQLRARAARVELEQLELLDPGTLLHWEFRHYVVFERLHAGHVELVDPGLGRRRLPLASVGRAFTGVAILLEPGEGFQRGAGPKSRGREHWRVLTEQPGILVRVLLASVLLQVFSLAAASATGALVDRAVPRSDSQLLQLIGCGLAALATFHFLLSCVRGQLLLYLRTHLDARMTLSFLDRILGLPLPFLQLRSTGDLMSRINANAVVRDTLTSGLLSGVLDGALVVVNLAILLTANASLGVTAVSLALVQSLVILLTRHRQQELLAESLRVEAAAQGFQVELLGGLETLKAMGSEHRAAERWAHLYVDVLNASLSRGQLSAWSDALAASLRFASPLVILVVGCAQVLHGDLTLGRMLSLAALSSSFLGPFSSLMATAAQFQLLETHLDRLRDVTEAAPEQDRSRPLHAPKVSGDITLERVCFRYSADSALAVNDVSLRIRPGQRVAIVGSSGSGKSTVASLMVGLVRPSSGDVHFDGFSLKDVDLRLLRQQVGVVLQAPALFSGSIRSNVALTCPDAPLADVIAACKLARIHDEIVALPMGYETLLGDRGASLSGGQRQRLALARALLGKPSVLLLDEATSALDVVTERRVQEALASLSCTQIIIAHRLSTIVTADVILVLRDGQLVESGTHDELLRKAGAYAALVGAQASGGMARAG